MGCLLESFGNPGWHLGTLRPVAHCLAMLDHSGFLVTDLAPARLFYDAVAAAPGLGTKDIGPQAFLLGRNAEEPIPYLWIGTLRPSYWLEGSRPKRSGSSGTLSDGVMF